jgi:dTDP-L-rhamnose 4-epimerase
VFNKPEGDFMIRKKILITGGAGFIGSNLALKLLERGYDVKIFDNLSEQVHGNLQDSCLYNQVKNVAEIIRGDVRNRKELGSAVEGTDIIVHLAAETGTGQSMYEVSKYVETNSLGTANLLNILVNDKTNAEKVIIASSRAIYGEGKYTCSEHGVQYPEHRQAHDMRAGRFEPVCVKCSRALAALPTDENSLIHPSSVYGITKYNQEQLVLKVCESINVSAVAFRYQNVYGPGQSLINPYTGILSIFSSLIRQGKDINIFEDGNETRDFVFIDDVIDATIAGIEKEDYICDAFNVGTGIASSVSEITKMLMMSYNKFVNAKITGDYRLGDIRHNFADLKKISRELNYNPHYSIKEGIELFCRWVDSQDIKNSLYEKSLDEMKNKGLLFKKKASTQLAISSRREKQVGK